MYSFTFFQLAVLLVVSYITANMISKSGLPEIILEKIFDGFMGVGKLLAKVIFGYRTPEEALLAKVLKLLNDSVFIGEREWCRSAVTSFFMIKSADAGGCRLWEAKGIDLFQPDSSIFVLIKKNGFIITYEETRNNHSMVKAEFLIPLPQNATKKPVNMYIDFKTVHQFERRDEAYERTFAQIESLINSIMLHQTEGTLFGITTKATEGMSLAR